MDNSFHWTQVAITVAQGLGMHQRLDLTLANTWSENEYTKANKYVWNSVKNSSLSDHEKRIWKRIWWTLFCRERTLALSRGRPFTIRESETDIEEVTADDFDDDFSCCKGGGEITVRYFLQYIKLSRLVGEILQHRQLFSKTSFSLRLKHKLEFEHRLHCWYDGLPADLRWEPANQYIWSSVLQLYY